MTSLDLYGTVRSMTKAQREHAMAEIATATQDLWDLIGQTSRPQALRDLLATLHEPPEIPPDLCGPALAALAYDLDGDGTMLDRAVHMPLRTESLARAKAALADIERRRNAFCHANLRLVSAVAMRSKHRQLELDDKIQCGCLGLMRAVRGFRCDRGTQFSTYAINWIKCYLQRSDYDLGTLIRKPVHVYETRLLMRRAQAKLTQQLQRKPTIDEVAASLGRRPETLQRAVDALSGRPASLDERIGDDGDGTMHDLLADECDDPDAGMRREEVARKVRAAMDRLTDRERTILLARFQDEADTLNEVGAKIGLTRERVRQIQQGALEKMRLALKRQGIDCSA